MKPSLNHSKTISCLVSMPFAPNIGRLVLMIRLHFSYNAKDVGVLYFFACPIVRFLKIYII